MKQVTEVWLRGQTIPGIVPLLQPVAHALLQAREEIILLLENFPDHLLWKKPGGCASVGFHLLHINGVLDRLITYAEGKALTEPQLIYLKQETQQQPTSTTDLVIRLNEQVNITIDRLTRFSGDLTEKRTVGRAALPSTVIGLCIHAAEHTTRHTGQLLVTATVLTNSNNYL